MPIWLSLLLGTTITAAPQFVPILPHELQGALTAIFAIVNSTYHLYQPSPTVPTVP